MVVILEEGWSGRPCTTKRYLIIVIFQDETNVCGVVASYYVGWRFY